MKHIPNLFTLLNLFCGCIAIVFALQNGIDIVYTSDGEQFVKFTERLCIASIFIGIAAIVDFLDGFVARLINATSEMGKQLDSLSDVVTFGVAPGIILFQFLRMSFIRENDGIEATLVAVMPAFIFSCAGAYRLARFNIDPSQTEHFKGVPIPAAGLVIASLPMIYWYNNSDVVYNLLTNKWLLYALVFLMSWLMVSNMPMMALKFKDFSVRNNLPKFILLAVALIAATVFQWLSVPVIFIAYIILSLVFRNKTTQ